VDPADGAMTYACAGHPPPLLLDAAPRFLMEGRSAPLGALFGDQVRPQAEHELPRGAGLLLYTDGLVERRGESIDAGLDRLVAAVGPSAADRPAELVDRLVARLLPPAADDDVCLLCFARR
jgi:serine phosphatase RsbU (regulator of sigma subunit)